MQSNVTYRLKGITSANKAFVSSLTKPFVSLKRCSYQVVYYTRYHVRVATVSTAMQHIPTNYPCRILCGNESGSAKSLLKSCGQSNCLYIQMYEVI